MTDKPIGLLTADAWEEALLRALDDYKAALHTWNADRSEANLRLLELAAAHVDAIEAQWPPEPPETPR
jgi:hypothetical protein